MKRATVKKITEGRLKDNWGVYENGVLKIYFSTKRAATRDANRRNKESN